MPLPALFGLSALFANIYALAVAALKFFVVYMTVRTVVRLIGIGLVAVTIYGTFQGIETLIETASTSIPGFMIVPITWVIPSNLSTCVSIIVACHISVIVMKFYIWAISVIAP